MPRVPAYDTLLTPVVRQRLHVLGARKVSSVKHPDSVEKLLTQIARLAHEPVVYQGKALDAQPPTSVLLTPSVFRRFICAEGCSACCVRFTLDYLPEEIERAPYRVGFAPRMVEVNGVRSRVWTRDQSQDDQCPFLRLPRGSGLGCAQFPLAPLSCVSAPQVQILQHATRTWLTKKPFGRAWQLDPSPQCAFLPWGVPTAAPLTAQAERDLAEFDALLARFESWAAWFGLSTALPAVRAAVQRVQRQGRMPRGTLVAWSATTGFEAWERA